MKLVAAVAAVLVLAGCSSPIGGKATASASVSASPSGSALAQPTGKLDAEVATPPGFPSDVPIYPGARLTAGASFSSSGQASWGMEWETLASVAKVQAFYADKLNQGDWTMTVAGTTGSTFAATFSRKSNAHVGGTLAANNAAGVTKILMSLVSTA